MAIIINESIIITVIHLNVNKQIYVKKIKYIKRLRIITVKYCRFLEILVGFKLNLKLKKLCFITYQQSLTRWTSV